MDSIARRYGLNPIALAGEDANAWLRHLSLLRAAGEMNEDSNGE